LFAIMSHHTTLADPCPTDQRHTSLVPYPLTTDRHHHPHQRPRQQLTRYVHLTGGRSFVQSFARITPHASTRCVMVREEGLHSWCTISSQFWSTLTWHTLSVIWFHCAGPVMMRLKGWSQKVVWVVQGYHKASYQLSLPMQSNAAAHLSAWS